MAELTRNKDWSTTPVGAIDTWPSTLLTTVNLILNSTFPMFIFWGERLTQFYNDAYRPSLGQNGKHPTALGQDGADCWPEIWSAIHPIIENVYKGIPYFTEDQLLPIYRNGKIEDVYWTFSYSPIYETTGDCAGVLVTCMETTEKVVRTRELKQAKEALELSKAETEQQRDRLHRFFMEAPAGICVLSGPNFVFEMVNPVYQQFFPGRQLLGLPVLEALPELYNQPIEDILKDVYYNNKSFVGSELKVPLARYTNGPLEDRYFNFAYLPRQSASGEPDGVMVFVFEVTDTVAVKLSLEKAEDTLKLSIQAANLGTFDMDLEKGTMFWDERCRTLFGINHNNEVNYEKDFIEGLHPDDRERITDTIANYVFNKSLSNGHYDVQYRTIGAEDNKLRWVRAMGKTYFDKHDKPVRFIGSVIDITEQKEDELRKNDFIGMVSHELKTPLTSLQGYFQILRYEADNPKLAPTILSRVDAQLKKMQQLINGFLNISRFESGKLHLEKEYFGLDALVNEIMDDIILTAPNYNITLQPCTPVTVYADKSKIDSVIRNLLTNAIKYSRPDTNIDVACIKHEHHVEISVTDYGIGIKKEDIEKLFDRYYRVDNVNTKTVSGFGIGLYLSAEIIKRHGGIIGVDSEVDKGSRFYFTLPL